MHLPVDAVTDRSEAFTPYLAFLGKVRPRRHIVDVMSVNDNGDLPAPLRIAAAFTELARTI